MSAARQRRLPVLAVTGVLVAGVTAGCAEQPDAGNRSGSAGSVDVEATDTACTVSSDTAEAGTLTFHVTNKGSEVNEFYLLAEDGKRILGEVENIGPGLSRNLVVSATEGTYVAACKPGMTGKGIRTPFTVTGGGSASGQSAREQQAVDQAVRRYTDFVHAESAQLLRGTKAFVRAYVAGDDEQARHLYPRARTHWERIETVAESFGDLDPKMDAREADLEPGQRWTGWHRMEKDLWPPASYDALSVRQRHTLATDLLANTRTLDRRVQRLELSLDQVANGSTALLEEVATGKVTGEEEHWSHTDLWDFQANVDGAHVAYRQVRTLLQGSDPALATTLDRRFHELQTLLDQHRTAGGFVTYDKLSEAQVATLADAVNALAEPLSRLTAAVLA